MIGSVGWAGDGDGPLAPKRTVLSGTEEIFMTLVRDDNYRKPSNQFYLRQDAHGGDTVETNCEGSNPDSDNCNTVNPFDPHPVLKGAMSWTLFPIAGVIAGIPPEDQFLDMVSIKDDYNGSNNPNNSGLGIAQSDNSYRMDSAATYYDLVIFNNDEVPLQLEEDRPPVSPPPPFTQIVIRIAVKCIDAFEFELQGIAVNDRIRPADGSDFVFINKFGNFSIADLFSLDNTGAVQNFLAQPVPVNDELGPGWIRFDRIFTRDYFYDVNKAAFGVCVNYDGERGTYVTIAKSILISDAFGVGWYLPLSATSVSDNDQVVAEHENERND